VHVVAGIHSLTVRAGRNTMKRSQAQSSQNNRDRSKITISLSVRMGSSAAVCPFLEVCL